MAQGCEFQMPDLKTNFYINLWKQEQINLVWEHCKLYSKLPAHKRRKLQTFFWLLVNLVFQTQGLVEKIDEIGCLVDRNKKMKPLKNHRSQELIFCSNSIQNFVISRQKRIKTSQSFTIKVISILDTKSWTEN